MAPDAPKSGLQDLPPAWYPPSWALEDSNLARILKKHGFSTYEDFLEWSLEDPEAFWRSTLEDLGVVWQTPFRRVLVLSRGKPWARWFVEGRLNLTETALDQPVTEGHGDDLALLWEGEEQEIQRLTYRQLLVEVDRWSRALEASGVEPGDRVALLLPMIPQAAMALLAVARTGAVAVPLFSGFGPDAVRVRLQASEARLLITTPFFRRNGRTVDLLAVAREATQGLKSLVNLWVVPFLGAPPTLRSGEVWLPEILPDARWPVPRPRAFPSDHPFMLIYTSGTTGRPKGTVHVHAGFPIKAAQDLYHLFDLRPGDRLYWLTDLGWMMGPWLVLGALFHRATMVLYEGAPTYPHPGRLWELWQRHRVTVAGLAPTLVRAVMPHGTEVPKAYPLESLRILGSTGEPWNPEPWLWTLKHVGKGRVPIINYSGGTEISGGILGCVVLRPLKPASFNTVVPGVDADVVDENGTPVVGEPGYLVIRNVNPGMTRGFWQEPERYLETYWRRFPGLWDHGDLALKDADGDFYILGRADDTLKVAGKRLGPAEMESVAVEHPAVQEAAVIGKPHPVKGEVPVVFVVLKPGYAASPETVQKIQAWIARRMGKALKPEAVYVLSDLPKTRNAKVMRRVLRRVFLGEPPGDLSALVNPEVLKEVQALRSSGPSSTPKDP